MRLNFGVKSGLLTLVAAIIAAVVIMNSTRPPKLGPKDGEDLPPTELDRVKVGDLAPDFSLLSYSGDVITLSDYRGSRNVVLVFYRGHW
jgi:cytochrome oxidase Cu insertion factor (SCO1/SenC/PrrC family)